jgi:hypothetical protein
MLNSINISICIYCFYRVTALLTGEWANHSVHTHIRLQTPHLENGQTPVLDAEQTASNKKSR